MRESEMDLVYRVLDDQLVDADGRRCGRVDDLEIHARFGEPAYLTGILSGPGAWPGRLPRRLRPIGMWLFGRGVLGERVVHLPWEAVDDIEQGVVRLRQRASDLGLAREEGLARTLEKLPDS